MATGAIDLTLVYDTIAASRVSVIWLAIGVDL
jgi:hypothetical protein